MSKVLITGATSGLGKQLVIQFSKSGFQVLAVGKQFKKSSNKNIKYINANFEKKKSIINLIKLISKKKDINYIIFCHGIMNFGNFLEKKNIFKSKIFYVNFYSILIIIKNLIKNRFFNKRIGIIFITSHAIKVKNTNYLIEKYNDWQIYKISKYFLILLNFYLNKKFKNIKTISINPGRMSTNLGKNNGFLSAIIKIYLFIFGKSKLSVAEMFMDRLIIKKKFNFGDHINLDYSKVQSFVNLKKDILLIDKMIGKI